MTIISRSALLPYNSIALFEMVNDIEAYPEFMDGCVGAQILRREGDLIEARLDLAKGGISQSFSTRNYLVGTEAIVLELLEGPFEFFEGRWGFQELGEAACKISLELEFKVNSKLLGVAAAKLFELVTNNLVDALGRRAQLVHG
ncbi:MAG: type II toxin-antitoxin system RatA family toxin [Halioglobus sp.]